MIYNNPSYDAALGLHCLALIRALEQTTDQVTLDNLVRTALEGAAFRSFRLPEDNLTPSAYYAFNDDYAVIAFEGATTAAQGSLLVDNYSGGGLFHLPVDRNAYARRLANDVTLVPTWPAVVRAQRMIITGHSLGGAAATALAEIRAEEGNQSSTKLITFGSPKYAVASIEPIIRQTEITRWMNDDDPVPFVIPRIEDAWLVTAVTVLAEALSWQRFIHTKGGTQLDIDGNQTAQGLPTNVTPNPTLALGNWLWNLDRPGLGPHSVGEYQRRMGLRLEQHAAMNQPGAQAGGVIAEHRTTNHQVQQQQSDLRRIIRNDGNAQARGPIIVPPDQIFYKVKVGDVWAVGFGGRIISVGYTRRKAGHLASAGNIFVRRLLRQAVVDPDALVGQWAAFCQAAQQPESGIVPLLHTRIGP